MLSLEPWTIFWTVVNVLVLFVALRHFLIKLVMGVIEQRNEMIKQQFNAAQKTQDEATSRFNSGNDQVMIQLRIFS